MHIALASLVTLLGGQELQWVRPPKSFSAPRAAVLRSACRAFSGARLAFSSRLWAAFHTLAALFVPAVLDLPWAVVLRFACRALIIGAALFPLRRLARSNFPAAPIFYPDSPALDLRRVLRTACRARDQARLLPLGRLAVAISGRPFSIPISPRCYAPPPRSVRRLSW